MTTMTTTTTATECPACGKKGKNVKPLTLRALLKDEFVGQVADAEYRFCDAKDCDIVYYGNGQTFTKSQLKVAVGVKETSGERPLCYCFGHSVGTITLELRTKGQSEALEDIRHKMKDPGCACEVKNPSGSCCLGTVAKGIETAKAELDINKPASNRAEIFSKVGTVLSAIMASACCWLPLVLLAFGVSGAGIAGALESYRPLFMVLTFGFLASAFYFTYRPRKAASASEDCCAGTHDCCAGTPTTKGRFSMMTLNKVMLWGVTLLAVAFLFFPQYVSFFLPGGSRTGEPTADDPLVRTTSFTVEGMSCEGCSALVGKAIKDVPGVLSVQVDYDKKRAVVSTEACCPVPTEAILQSLEKAGYRGEVVVTAENSDKSDKSNCCKSDKPDCCQQESKAGAPKQTPQGNDPDKQIVFKVEALACPAVKGIGCGHMLRPVLASLDKIDGVDASSTNYTGTMIRVSVTTATDRDKVTEAVRKVLAENNPVALTGEELKTALVKEQWRGTGRVGELSAIEFRAITMYRVKAFATAEKLDKDTTDKLLKMANDQWERITKEAYKDGATQPEDWGNRCKKSLPLFLEQAKEVLTAEQVERFKQALATRCRGDDRPEAPPAPTSKDKTP